MRQLPPQRDTEAWVFQAWAAFAIAFGGMAVGIVFLPLDTWTLTLANVAIKHLQGWPAESVAADELARQRERARQLGAVR